MRSVNASMKRLMIGAVLAVAIGGNAFAQTKSAPPAAKAEVKPAAGQKPDDKVDISDLENKYWAPKDTDFSVVQNRTYTKAHRFALSALIGPIVNDPYSTGY